MKFAEKLRAKNENPIGAAPVTLAFLGDSVTQGCFELYRKSESGFETEFRVDDGYHTKLRSLFEKCYPGAPINMIHAGISGDNAKSGLERIERDVIAYKPDLTVVSFGLNDSCQGAEKLEIYRDSLEEIFKKLKASGSEVIFMTQNLPADKVSFEVCDEFQKMYAGMVTHFDDFLLYMEAARSVCTELDVPVCDCTKKWLRLKESGVDFVRLLSNRINHPTEDWHWMFAISLFEMIMEI